MDSSSSCVLSFKCIRLPGVFPASASATKYTYTYVLLYGTYRTVPYRTVPYLCTPQARILSFAEFVSSLNKWFPTVTLRVISTYCTKYYVGSTPTFGQLWVASKIDGCCVLYAHDVAPRQALIHINHCFVACLTISKTPEWERDQSNRKRNA